MKQKEDGLRPVDRKVGDAYLVCLEVHAYGFAVEREGEGAILEFGEFLELEDDCGVFAPYSAHLLGGKHLTVIIELHIVDRKTVLGVSVTGRDFDFDSGFTVFIIDAHKTGHSEGIARGEQHDGKREEYFLHHRGF